ncbi:ankyrin repeat-containing domain protein [Baffinella frigidus]|nr:ankyrin repeat-containing domain protein [Cryptophyta sp. CCMP2293]
MWRLAVVTAAVLSSGAALSAPGAPPGLRMRGGPCRAGILEPCSACGVKSGGERGGVLRAIVLRGGEGSQEEGPAGHVDEPAASSSSLTGSESESDESDPRIEVLKDEGVGKEEEMLDREAAAAAEAEDPEDAILDATARLWVATKEGNVAAVRAALAGGADAAMRDADGMNALHQASAWGRKAALEALLEGGRDLKAAASDGSSVLHLAAYYGHVDITQMLIKRGADVAAKDLEVSPQP